jgi:hypothetical protein
MIRRVEIQNKNSMSKNDKLTIRNSTAEFLIFTHQAKGDGIEVRVQDNTVWLTQKLIATLFEVDIRTINEHLKNIYLQGELTKESTIRKFRIVQTEGNRQVARNIDFYNLDAIIAVGYRVKSARATTFRQWATSASNKTNCLSRTLTKQLSVSYLRRPPRKIMM